MAGKIVEQLYQLHKTLGEKMHGASEEQFRLLYWVRNQLEEIATPYYVKRNNKKYGIKTIK